MVGLRLTTRYSLREETNGKQQPNLKNYSKYFKDTALIHTRYNQLVGEALPTSTW